MSEPKPLIEAERSAIAEYLHPRGTVAKGVVVDLLWHAFLAEQFWRGIVRSLPLRYILGDLFCPVCDQFVTTKERFVANKECIFEASAHREGCAWLLAQDEK